MDKETFKGTGIDFIRRKVRERGEETEKSVLAQLSPDAATIYVNALAVSWVDINLVAELYEVVAKTLYSEDPEPLAAMGRAMAHEDLTGIYKVLLRVATIPMVIERTARLWSTYHRRGTARIEREGDSKQADLVIDGYPELPESIRLNTGGYVQGVLDLTGSKNPQVTHGGGSPEAWRWHVTWE